MRRLLLVDDDPVARLVVAFLVREQGLSVTTAASAEEAQERLACAVTEGAPYDVLMAGHRMGGMSGVALLEWAWTATPRTARLMLTGDADAEGPAMTRGRADWFLRKPLDPHQIRRVLGTFTARGP